MLRKNIVIIGLLVAGMSYARAAALPLRPKSTEQQWQMFTQKNGPFQIAADLPINFPPRTCRDYADWNADKIPADVQKRCAAYFAKHRSE
jgi:hypothetical protein